MNNIKSIVMKTSIIVVVVLFIASFSSCSKIENLTNSGSKLVILDVLGTSLTGTTPDTHTAMSDVIRILPNGNATVINDNGIVSLTVQTLDPHALNPTYYQDITVDQIDVSFSRADGLNIQGENVPYSFSQRFSTSVSVGETVSIDFVLITHNAKSESPLVELVNLGSEHILKLEAKIIVYGKDGAGNRVQPAVGYISVWCANFADPIEEE